MDSKLLGGDTKLTAPKKKPVDALKRFADDLKSATNPEIARFREINQNRVDSFIRKPFEDVDKIRTEFHPTKSPKKPPFVHGTYNYDNILNKAYKPLQLDAPELQRSLGQRSRFGDGDGSFWDKWVISESPTKGLGLDEHGIPLAKRPHDAISGFKRFYAAKENRSTTQAPLNTIVKPYSERRQMRIAKEKEDEQVKAEGKDRVLPHETPQVRGLGLQDAAWEEVDEIIGAYHETDLENDLFSFLPPIDPVDKDKYFGNKARAEFFDIFRQLSRQSSSNVPFRAVDSKNALHKSEAVKDKSLEQKVRSKVLKSKRFCTSTSNLDEGEVAKVVEESSKVEPDKMTSLAPSHSRSSARTSTLKVVENPRPPQVIRSSALLISRRYSSGATAVDAFMERELESALESETKVLDEHLLRNDNAGICPRPLSARSRFLNGCLQSKLAPRPSLIIRKDQTATLNLEHQYMGDAAAILLASSLDGLPHVAEINIADNKLTDIGLTAIIKALNKCPFLTSLDISENKLDSEAAASLSQYLSSPSCFLINLVLRKSDVDDNEIGRFVNAITKSRSLIHIDLSSNLLGSNQNLHALDPSLTMGGKVLGDMLADSNCKIQSFKLAWNMIRFESAVYLMRSLQENSSLTYLDISFNCIGQDGAEALGASLHAKNKLKAINLSNNNITPRGCFAIIAGLRNSSTVSYVNMSNNPIGEIGARAIMMLIMEYGDRIDIDTRGCSIKLKDDLCTFDYLKPECEEYNLQLASPYDRAVAFEILRITSCSRDTLKLVDVKYTDPKIDSRGLQPLHLELRKHAMFNKFEESLMPPEYLIKAIKGVVNKRMSGKLDQTVTKFCHSCDPFSRRCNDREVDQLLNMLDIGYELWIKKLLFCMYDFNQTGYIGESELLDFLNIVLEEYIDQWRNVASYSSGKFVQFCNSLEYNLPETGNLVCKVTTGLTCPPIGVHLPGKYLVTQQSLERVMNALKLSDNSHTMIEYSLTGCQLRFNEARALYKLLIKESGEPCVTLHKLIPFMSTTIETKNLIYYVLKNDIPQKLNLKRILGSHYYRVSIGMYTGFYSLNLSRPNDKLALALLMNAARAAKLKREESDLGDISQVGNGLGFRNCVFNGVPCEINDGWYAALPIRGKIEFDFVDFSKPSIPFRSAISDARFVYILQQLKLIESKNGIDLNALYDSFQYENIAEKDNAECRNYSKRTHTFLLWCEQNAAMRENAIFPSAHMPAAPVVRINSPSIPKRDTSVAMHRSTAIEGIGTSDKRMSYIDGANNDGNSEVVIEKVYPVIHSDNVIEGFANMPITCEQLAIIVLLMGKIYTKESTDLKECTRLIYETMKKPFSSPRVEVIICLFSQIVNLENFYCVCNLLDPFEYALVIFRLGYLSIWNPLRPCGHYCLRTANREEKQLIRIFIALTISASTEQWMGYRDFEETKQEITNFHVSWGDESHIPQHAMISFQFKIPGESKGMYRARSKIDSFHSAMLALVLSKSPYSDITKPNSLPTMKRVKLVVIDQLRISLNFN